MEFISHSEEETIAFAKKIALSLRGGEVFALKGDLGAGKTIFTKGLAEGLGYKKIVNSPTFALMKIYKAALPEKRVKYICHIDAYRISSAEEVEAIGALEYFGRPDVVSIVEWPEKIEKILPRDAVKVEFLYGKKEGERAIKIKKVMR